MPIYYDKQTYYLSVRRSILNVTMFIMHIVLRIIGATYMHVIIYHMCV